MIFKIVLMPDGILDRSHMYYTLKKIDAKMLSSYDDSNQDRIKSQYIL